MYGGLKVVDPSNHLLRCVIRDLLDRVGGGGAESFYPEHHLGMVHAVEEMFSSVLQRHS